jgi:hypothetical protein
VCNIDQYKQIMAQCKTWSGPLSASIYLALYPLMDRDSDDGKVLSPANQAALRDAVMQVAQMMADVAALPPGGCQLDITLVWEMLSSEQDAALLYPFNMQRSLARLQVRRKLRALVILSLKICRHLVQKCNRGKCTTGCGMSKLTNMCNAGAQGRTSSPQ